MQLLFKVLGMNDKDFSFGTTKVFFKAGKFAMFDELMKTDPEHLKAMVAKLNKWILKYRWHKAQYCAWEVIKRMLMFT